jgi:hypothetical protein
MRPPGVDIFELLPQPDIPIFRRVATDSDQRTMKAVILTSGRGARMREPADARDPGVLARLEQGEL